MLHSFRQATFGARTFAPLFGAGEIAVPPALTFHPDYTYATAAMLAARRRPGGIEEDEALVLLLMQ